ncbi:MAG: hypothetical protein ACREIU_12080, partial [Planctomycetota bacterium]
PARILGPALRGNAPPVEHAQEVFPMRTPALLGAVLAVPLFAAGGPKEASVRWATSWSAAIEEAKARNVPVLVVFGKDH